MTDFFQQSIWLVPLYPLFAFLLLVLGRWTGLLQPKTGNILVISSTVMGIIHTLGFLATWGPGYQPVQETFHWLSVGNFHLDMGYTVDAAGMMMLLVVTIVSSLIQLYTHGYMSHDPGYSRFYAYLALFNFSMLSLVLSPNLFQMYVFWEMVGVSSYLLIGFWFTKPSAAAAAMKAFLMNRVGDFGLLVGILSLVFFTYHWWPNGMLNFADMGGAAKVALEAAGPVPFMIMCLLIFMGPMAKSAQLPLHTWLPDAMEGPTPISALIHAATMVAAGVFLIARMYPVFTLSPETMTVIAWIGALTAIVAATIALTQTDIKKALAYSTMSQLGYMVMAMGIGAYTAGLFHLMTHAFFKAMLFLCSGSVIHGCHDEQDMRKMGGLKKYMPITAVTYLIGTIAITGILPFSGFWSKDEIIASASTQGPLFAIALVTAGMTAFYMFRTYFMTFEGDYRGEAHPHESPASMTFPLVALAVPSVVVGYLLSGQAFGLPGLGQWVHFGHPHHEPMNLPVMLTSWGIAVGGFFLAMAMYSRKRVLDPGVIVSACRPLYTLFANKWYFDELYLGVIAKKLYLPFASLSAWFDKTVIDGVVTMTASSVSTTGGVLKSLQTGRLQTYLIVFFLAILVLAMLVMWMV